jgi:hypothetical protein
MKITFYTDRIYTYYYFNKKIVAEKGMAKS